MCRETMKPAERFAAYIAGLPVDRAPVIEWAPWWGLTVDRWRAEGLPDSAESVGEIQAYFGLDRCLQTGFSAFTEATPGPAGFGTGIMKTEDEYIHKIRPTLFPSPESLFPEERLRGLEADIAKGDAIRFFTASGFFWYPRELFGIEAHLFSFYDQPELYARICEDYCEWLEKVFRRVFSRCRFDFMTFAEDMSYNNGPMLSKAMFDEFLAPYYKKLISVIHEYSIPVIIDSDGDITLAVDWYAGVGADGMLPLERQAGVDVSVYVEKQPGMTYIGHFDKMCMKHGEQAMRAEFERIFPSMCAGKVIPSVDHQTPPDVSMENYKIYVRLLKEYAAKVGEYRRNGR